MNDIELIVIPRTSADVMIWFQQQNNKNRLWPRKNMKGHNIAWDGPRFKAVEWYDETAQQSFPIDVFLTTHDRWGTIFLLRTGPGSEANPGNQLLVTSYGDGGLCPNDLAWREGELVRLKTPVPKRTKKEEREELNEASKHATAIRTNTETSVFKALGFPYIPPPYRGRDMYLWWANVPIYEPEERSRASSMSRGPGRKPFLLVHFFDLYQAFTNGSVILRDRWEPSRTKPAEMHWSDNASDRVQIGTREFDVHQTVLHVLRNTFKNPHRQNAQVDTDIPLDSWPFYLEPEFGGVYGPKTGENEWRDRYTVDAVLQMADA